MVSLKNDILSHESLSTLRQDIFLYFKTQEQIAASLSAQENMKKWISHHIAVAQQNSHDSVDVQLRSEEADSEMLSHNSDVISRIESLWYTVVINESKTTKTPLPFIRNVVVTISWL